LAQLAQAWNALQAISGWLSTLLEGIMILYTLIALRRVFEQSWMRTAAKLCGLLVVYLGMLALTETAVVFYASLKL
jgi:hypothetical protein